MGKITKPITFDLTLEVPGSGESGGGAGGGLETTSTTATKRKRDENDHDNGEGGGKSGSMHINQTTGDAKYSAYGYFVKAKRSEAEAKLRGGGRKQLKKLLRSMWDDLGPQGQSKYEKMASGDQSNGNGSSSSSSSGGTSQNHHNSSKQMSGRGHVGRNVPYDLTGVVVHHGGSIHSGHYVAFVKAPNGQWHEMNDSEVRLVNPQHVLKQQAYILFYTKRMPPPGTATFSLDDDGQTILIAHTLIITPSYSLHIRYHAPSDIPPSCILTYPQWQFLLLSKLISCHLPTVSIP